MAARQFDIRLPGMAVLVVLLLTKTAKHGRPEKNMLEEKEVEEAKSSDVSEDPRVTLKERGHDLL